MGEAMQEIFIDTDGTDIRVITFDIDEHGVRSVQTIDVHGVPVDLETMANGSYIDPLHWKWSDAVKPEFIDHHDRAYLFNYRRLRKLDLLVELLREEENLVGQLEGLRATIKEMLA